MSLPGPVFVVLIQARAVQVCVKACWVLEAPWARPLGLFAAAPLRPWAPAGAPMAEVQQ